MDCHRRALLAQRQLDIGSQLAIAERLDDEAVRLTHSGSPQRWFIGLRYHEDDGDSPVAPDLTGRFTRFGDLAYRDVDQDEVRCSMSGDRGAFGFGRRYRRHLVAQSLEPRLEVSRAIGLAVDDQDLALGHAWLSRCQLCQHPLTLCG